jgi:hypothetical protein
MDQADLRGPLDVMTRSGVEVTRAVLESFGALARSAAAINPFLTTAQRSCCDIPPACWLPRPLGELTSSACPCGTALIRFRVSNCQPVPASVMVRVPGESGLDIKVTPQQAVLQPMERKWFTVVATVPQDACKGEAYENVLWVAGCNEHYLRWTVRVADGISGGCHEIEVEDCPDYVHHWYDHFYCKRPCFAGQRTGSG